MKVELIRPSLFRPNRKRDIYYPLLHEDGRSSIQMMTVMDMNSNTLVLDEIVLQHRAYRLEQYGEDFYLPPNGKYSDFDSKPRII